MTHDTFAKRLAAHDRDVEALRSRVVDLACEDGIVGSRHDIETFVAPALRRLDICLRAAPSEYRDAQESLAEARNVEMAAEQEIGACRAARDRSPIRAPETFRWLPILSAVLVLSCVAAMLIALHFFTLGIPAWSAFVLLCVFVLLNVEWARRWLPRTSLRLALYLRHRRALGRLRLARRQISSQEGRLEAIDRDAALAADWIALLNAALTAEYDRHWKRAEATRRALAAY